MKDEIPCKGCPFLQMLSHGPRCRATYYCENHRYVEHPDAGWRPAGYRTPEDGLPKVEKRSPDGRP